MTNNLKSKDPQWLATSWAEGAASHCQTPLPSPISVWARSKSLGGNSIRHKKGASSSTIMVSPSKLQNTTRRNTPSHHTFIFRRRRRSSLKLSRRRSSSKSGRTRRARPKTARITTNDQRRPGPDHFKGTQRVRTWTRMATDIVLCPQFGSRWVPPPQRHVIHPEQQHESKCIQRQLSSGFNTQRSFTLYLRWWFAIPVTHGPSHVAIQVLQPAECIFWCGYGQEMRPVNFERSREKSSI